MLSSLIAGKITFVRAIPFLLLQLTLSIGSEFVVHGQNNPTSKRDTLTGTPYYMELSEIPYKLQALKTRIKSETDGLITNESIKAIEAKNQEVIASVYALLYDTSNLSDNSRNIRYLENRLVELSQEKKKIIGFKSDYTDLLNSVDNLKNELTKESLLLRNTLKKLAGDSLTPGVSDKINETLVFVDSTLLVLANKSNLLLEILDRTIPLGVEIDKETEKNKALIVQRQANAFERDHPPFFKLNFRSGYDKEIHEAFAIMKKTEFAELTKYFNERVNAFIFLFFLVAGLVYLFKRIKKRIILQNSGYGYFYKEIFSKVLSHPLSATLILAFFFSLLIFQDRPVVLREFSFYIIVFPLIHLLQEVITKRYHVFLYSFGIVIFLYMILLFLPNESVVYRILLLLISLAEIAFLTVFILRFDHTHKLKPLHKGALIVFTFLHLALAISGLISNLTGRIILTEIVLSAVFLNIFYGLALFISTLLLDGLLVTGFDSVKWQRLNVIRLHGEVIKRRLTDLLNILSILFWITLVLNNFRIVDYIYDKLRLFLTSEIKLGSASFSLDFILIFFVVIYMSILLAKLIRILLEDDILSRLPLSKGLPHSIAMMVKYVLITCGFLLAVNAAGISLDKLTIVIGAMSVGIGFGLQNIFNNLVSGFILLFERPIQLGDTVQVGELTGRVKIIGLRSSNIVTFDGAAVIVPNGQLISNEVINWTLSDQKRRIELIIRVAYESDIKLVVRLLNEILRKQNGVVQDPIPSVFLRKLGESSIEFTLLFWIGDYIQDLIIKSGVLLTILEEFEKHGIKIPYPQQDVHLVTATKSFNDKG
jgi:potassium-dependent mechanosensitive channel